MKTGTNAPWSAESANSARIRFGHLERDRERRHRAADAEVARRHDLAHQRRARATGRSRTRRRRCCARAASVPARRASVATARCAARSSAGSVQWPTSPHKKSGFTGRSASGSRTAATRPRSRRTSAASRRRSTPATPDGRRRSTATLISRIDRAVKRGALHRNTGARKKSRAARIRCAALAVSHAVTPRRVALARLRWHERTQPPRVPRARRLHRRARRRGQPPARRPSCCRGRRRRSRRSRLPTPRNMPIDHFVDPDDGEPVVRPLLRLAARDADGMQQPALPGPGAASRSTTRHFSTLGSGGAEWQGLRPSATPATAGTRAARSCSGGFIAPRVAATTSSRSPTTTRASSASSTTRRARTRSTTAASARCSPRPGRTATTSGRGSRAARTTTRSGRHRPATSGRRSSTARIGHGLSARYYDSDLPFSARVGRARRALDQPDRASTTRTARAGHAAEHHDRRPAVPGRRRRRRPLGRRAPARRRAPRPGVHGRRGNAFVESPNYRRGALFIIYDEWGGFFDHVRPPRVPDDRASAQPRRGLRPDGLPHPGRGRLAVRARNARRARRPALPRGPRRVRPRVDPEADHRTASGSAT